jgi:hypothetical protein
VYTYTFATTPEQEAQIASNIDALGGPIPCFCASAVSNALGEVGPFKGVGAVTPGGLQGQLESLPNVKVTKK